LSEINGLTTKIRGESVYPKPGLFSRSEEDFDKPTQPGRSLAIFYSKIRQQKNKEVTSLCSQQNNNNNN